VERELFVATATSPDSCEKNPIKSELPKDLFKGK
jgi:hypothetical protein